MPDISKCNGNKCNIKTKCYRFTSKSNDWQSWLVPTYSSDGKCEFFWDNSDRIISHQNQNYKPDLVDYKELEPKKSEIDSIRSVANNILKMLEGYDEIVDVIKKNRRIRNIRKEALIISNKCSNLATNTTIVEKIKNATISIS